MEPESPLPYSQVSYCEGYCLGEIVSSFFRVYPEFGILTCQSTRRRIPRDRTLPIHCFEKTRF